MDGCINYLLREPFRLCTGKRRLFCTICGAVVTCMLLIVMVYNPQTTNIIALKLQTTNTTNSGDIKELEEPIVTRGNFVEEKLRKIFRDPLILTNFDPPNVLEENPEKDKKIILAWNRMFGDEPFSPVNNCENKDKCVFTMDRSYVKVADAIVFHSRDTVDKPYPRYRNQNQVYIFWTLEAPHNAGEWVYPKNFFNWTMTYSPKSEVIYSYSGTKFVKLNSTDSSAVRRFDAFAEEEFLLKKNAIFGLISNCEDRRMEMVERINNYYPFNLAGRCGFDENWIKLCPKQINGMQQDCKNTIEKTINSHLFHFVMENSDCWSYVTEKTFSRIHLNSIPIASRRAVYEPLNFPPKTFIFLDDFPNVQQFAAHLRYLERNKSAYVEYFEWREGYGTISIESPWCSLCTKLVDGNYSTQMLANPFMEYSSCYTDPIWTPISDSRFFSLIFTIIPFLSLVLISWLISKTYLFKNGVTQYERFPSFSLRLTFAFNVGYKVYVLMNSRKKREITASIIIFIGVVFIVELLQVRLLDFKPDTVLQEKPLYERSKKVILAWNRMFNYEPFWKTASCPLKDKCVFTEDRSYAQVADAIVFHSRDTVDRPHPQYRSEKQIYVFWTLETPENAGLKIYPDYFFNWTMTFSPYSDIQDPYSSLKFAKINDSSNTSSTFQVFPPFPEDLFAQKKKAIFGLISNCGRSEYSRRMDIVNFISEHLVLEGNPSHISKIKRNRIYPVHLAGQCGFDWKWINFCPKGRECQKKIEDAINSHMFYLALENSDCWSYVSEKTFGRLHLQSIPIVSRRKVYEPLKFPPKTFIFLDDFKNEHEFVKYLRYLEHNETAYMEYFQWRHEYGTVNSHGDYNWCQICTKLVTGNYTNKTLKDPFESYTKCYPSDTLWREDFYKIRSYPLVFIFALSIFLCMLIAWQYFTERKLRFSLRNTEVVMYTGGVGQMDVLLYD